MALEGTLRDFSFADILQLISLQRKTGVLTLKNEENVVTISFMEGRIVGASSLNQHVEDRLGLILLKSGALTETELEAALRRQEETLQRLGRILIDHHVVEAERVRKALEQQILQIIYRVFRWADGDYHFSQETDIDYDRDLMVPMAADSVIMEGARMTDEWPFIDKRLPSRTTIFTKVNPGRHLEVVDEEDETFDELSFSFTDSPEDTGVRVPTGDRITRTQAMTYGLVNGHDSVAEIILSSPIIEFEACKALAELLDLGLIREATPEEVARHLSSSQAAVVAERPAAGAFPWLAVPFLVLLGFSLTVMPVNPLNPVFNFRATVWDRHVQESTSWFRMDSLARAAETQFFLSGLYPEAVDALLSESPVTATTTDPWGRPYRIVIRGSKLMITGLDRSGHAVPLLLLSRPLAWEEGAADAAHSGQPGVIFLE